MGAILKTISLHDNRNEDWRSLQWSQTTDGKRIAFSSERNEERREIYV